MRIALGSTIASRTNLLLFLLASFYCTLNAFKPLQIDDAAYFYFARQMPDHSLDPYGFQLLWYEQYNQANDVLAPPLLPYSWAFAMRLFGDSPVLCKLALFPWSVLLVYGLHGLFRRFAEDWALPLTTFTALSPALWPSLNLMLDIPALGMSLCALHVFLRACDEDDFKRAVLAGLLAGMAIETKYTGFITPAAMVFAGALFRRWRLIPAALLTTAQVFVSWELLMAVLYNHSHFFNTASGQTAATAEGGLLGKIAAVFEEKQVFLPVLFTLLGGVAPALLLLGLAALGLTRRWLIVTAALVLAGILAIAFDYSAVGSRFQAWLQFLANGINFGWEFKLSDAIFMVIGLATFALLIVTGYHLVSSPPLEDQVTPPIRRGRRLTAFLLLWLGMEVLGYFMMTPFPAERRVLGIMVVGTLLIGRLVAVSSPNGAARRNLQVVLAVGVLFGLGYFALDFFNARAQQIAANEAADWIHEQGGTRIWFTGHWGFQYYAEHRGMEPLYVGGPTAQPGDYLAIPDLPHNQQSIQLDPQCIVEQHRVIVEDLIPLSTVPNFYGGTAGLEHHNGPRMVVRIYRVLEPFNAKAPPTPP